MEPNVLDSVNDFFKLYTCGINIDNSLLVGSIHQRVQINKLFVDVHHMK